MKLPKVPLWTNITHRRNPRYLNSLWLGVVAIFFWAPSTFVAAVQKPIKEIAMAFAALCFGLAKLVWAIVRWVADKIHVVALALVGRLSTKGQVH